MSSTYKHKKIREDWLTTYHLCIIETLLTNPNSTSDFICDKWAFSTTTFYRYVNELEKKWIIFIWEIYLWLNQREYRYSMHDNYLSDKRYKPHDNILEISNMNTKIVFWGKISIEYNKEKNAVLVNWEDFNKQSYIKWCRDWYKDATSKINKPWTKNKISFYVDDEEQVLKIKEEWLIQLVKDYVK